MSAARNDGIRSARADWIAFLDDDDVWAPTKLRRQLDALHAQRRRWAYAGEVLVDAELRIVAGRPPPPPEDVIERLARHNSVPAGASNVVVNGDVLSRVGGFDESLTSSEDWDLWIRLARDGRPAWVRDALVAVAIHPGGASRDVRAMLEQAAIVASRYGLPLDRVRHLRWAAWMSMLDGRRVDAAGYYVRAAAAGDARSLARAAAALAAPGFFTRTRAPGEQAGTTGAWLEEARAWVEALATP